MAFAGALATLAALLLGGLAFLRQYSTASTRAASTASFGTTAPPPLRRRPAVLVAVQVALAVTLLVGSALMVQSFWRLLRVDPGFDPRSVLTVEAGLPGTRAPQHRQIYARLLERVRALPGVTSAGAASSLPLDRPAYSFPFATVTTPVRTLPPVPMKFITPGYFETMRIPVLEGTGFAVDQHTEPPDPVVVSAALARRLFPGESAIGKRIVRLALNGERVTMFDVAAKAALPTPPWTIAGVVADTRETSLRVSPNEVVYVPIREPTVERMIAPINVVLVMRTTTAPAALISGVRRVIRETEPLLSMARIRTMNEIVDSSIARERFLAIVLALGASASLLLGVVGVYGVVAHTVRRREHEIGIRVSLGAGPRQIAAMVAGGSAASVVGGAIAGLALSQGAAQTLRSFLFQVSATDARTTAGATVLLLAVAFTAGLVPALRAAALDPAATLRQDR